MLYLQHTITLGIFSLLTWGCGNSDKQKGEAEQAPLADKVWYSNPVIDSDNPDPTVIKAERIFLFVCYRRKYMDTQIQRLGSLDLCGRCLRG